ncbi:hypothetical protein [Paenibacillus chitinolyticus]
MAKIYAPNKEYTGVSAGVSFVGGIGETTDNARLEWFSEHGYEVEELAETPQQPADPELEDLRAQAKELGIRGYHNMAVEKLTAAIAEKKAATGAQDENQGGAAGGNQ